jgi:hypothetical protein
MKLFLRRAVLLLNDDFDQIPLSAQKCAGNGFLRTTSVLC